MGLVGTATSAARRISKGIANLAGPAAMLTGGLVLTGAAAAPLFQQKGRILQDPAGLGREIGQDMLYNAPLGVGLILGGAALSKVTHAIVH